MMFERIGKVVAGVALALWRVLPVLLIDAAGLTAVGLISYGCWMITPPAGYIAGGVLLLAGAVVLGAKASRTG